MAYVYIVTYSWIIQEMSATIQFRLLIKNMKIKIRSGIFSSPLMISTFVSDINGKPPDKGVSEQGAE